MDPATIAAGVSAAKAGIDASKKVIGTISELNATINDLKDASVSSLSAYTKRTLISSRVYVEDQLANEDITPKIMKLLYQMYSSFILSAIGLTNLIASGKTIRTMMSAISTENFQSFTDIIKAQFGDAFIGASVENNAQTNAPTDPNLAKDPKVDYSAQAKEMEAKGAHLFCGNLLEVSIPTDDRTQTVKLYFYVQLLPTVTPSAVMYEFLYAHSSPSLKLRWAMWKAGEISFWKDFVFECDRVEKRKKALKVDKDGILREMEDHRNANFRKKTKQLTDLQKVKQREFRHNLANSMVICTKRTIDNVCKDLGINMKNFTQRQALMNDAMAVMMVVVDTNYGTVDLYMNGIEARGEYTSKMIDAVTKGKSDPLDMKELLTLISAGSMPRF